MEKTEKALEYLSCDPLLNVDMTECIARRICNIDYAENDGVMLTCGRTIMAHFQNADKLIDLLKGREFMFLVLRQKDIKDAVCAALGLAVENECWQGAYMKKEPLPQPNVDIRVLSEDYVDLCAAYYYDHTDYIRELIGKKVLLGLFEDGELAGFIGQHSEGAIGLLEVLPEYRRKGYGEALEICYVNYELQQGHIPYGHVVVGNEVSMALQRKLGNEFAEKTVYWIKSGQSEEE